MWGTSGVGQAEDLVRFRAESLWRDYHKPGTGNDDVIAAPESADFLPPQLFTTAWAPLPERVDGHRTGRPRSESVEEDDEGDALRKPTVGRVMLDQLREIDFEPYRLWLPPLDRPRPLDDIVEMYLGRPWDVNYAANPNLVFPVGVIDRPFKHDQQPLLVEAHGDGTNQLVIGTSRSGKTVALQTAICAAAMTHTPEQVQFYVLALQRFVAGHGGGTAARGWGGLRHRRGRRAAHHLGNDGTAGSATAQLPRVRGDVDGGLPPTQVRYGARRNSR